MSITISAIWIPIIITIILLYVMNRPYRSSGDYDFGFVFRLFWGFPILITWIIYLALT